jgi:predicted glycosyltransferase
MFDDRIVVPKKAIEGPSLLFFTSVFVGAGGTMTAESALLGIPTISCFPREPTIVEEYLMKKQLVFRENNPKKIVKRIYQILDDLEETRIKQRERAKNLISQMEDPIETIIKEIEGKT